MFRTKHSVLGTNLKKRETKLIPKFCFFFGGGGGGNDDNNVTEEILIFLKKI